MGPEFTRSRPRWAHPAGVPVVLRGSSIGSSRPRVVPDDPGRYFVGLCFRDAATSGLFAGVGRDDSSRTRPASSRFGPYLLNVLYISRNRRTVGEIRKYSRYWWISRDIRRSWAARGSGLLDTLGASRWTAVLGGQSSAGSMSGAESAPPSDSAMASVPATVDGWRSGAMLRTWRSRWGNGISTCCAVKRR